MLFFSITLTSCSILDNKNTPEGLNFVSRNVLSEDCEFVDSNTERCIKTSVSKFNYTSKFGMTSTEDGIHVYFENDDEFSNYLKKYHDIDWRYFPEPAALKETVIGAIGDSFLIGKFPEIANYKNFFTLALSVYMAERKIKYDPNAHSMDSIRHLSIAANQAILLGEFLYHRREAYSSAAAYFKKAQSIAQEVGNRRTYTIAEVYLYFINQEVAGLPTSTDYFENVNTINWSPNAIALGLDKTSNHISKSLCFLDSLSTVSKNECDRIFPNFNPTKRLLYGSKHNLLQHKDYVTTLNCLVDWTCSAQPDLMRFANHQSELMGILSRYEGWNRPQKYELTKLFIRMILDNQTGGHAVRFNADTKRLSQQIIGLCDEIDLVGCNSFFAKYGYTAVPLATEAVFFHHGSDSKNNYYTDLFDTFSKEQDFTSAKAILEEIFPFVESNSSARSYKIDSVKRIPFTNIENRIIRSIKESILANKTKVTNELHNAMIEDGITAFSLDKVAACGACLYFLMTRPEGSAMSQKLNNIITSRSKRLSRYANDIFNIIQNSSPRKQLKSKADLISSLDRGQQYVRFFFLQDYFSVEFTNAKGTTTIRSDISRGRYTRLAASYQYLLENGEVDIANSISKKLNDIFSTINMDVNSTTCDLSDIEASLIPFEAWFSGTEYNINRINLSYCTDSASTSNKSMAYVGIDYKDTGGFESLKSLPAERNSISEILRKKKQSDLSITPMTSFLELESANSNFDVVHISAHFTQGWNGTVNRGFVTGPENNTIISLNSLTELLANKKVNFLSLIGCSSGLTAGQINSEVLDTLGQSANSILYTLWNIDDASAGTFFDLLYRSLLLYNRDLNDSIIYSKKYFSTNPVISLRNPLYWAGYRHAKT